ncbi:hypothetical protein Btru_055636 [Bulinus truncatus]|nr:hypothetical protein Btru_055636 [Bulinus truncatus]
MRLTVTFLLAGLVFYNIICFVAPTDSVTPTVPPSSSLSSSLSSSITTQNETQGTTATSEVHTSSAMSSWMTMTSSASASPTQAVSDVTPTASISSGNTSSAQSTATSSPVSTSAQSNSTTTMVHTTPILISPTTAAADTLTVTPSSSDAQSSPGHSTTTTFSPLISTSSNTSLQTSMSSNYTDYSSNFPSSELQISNSLNHSTDPPSSVPHTFTPIGSLDHSSITPTAVLQTFTTISSLDYPSTSLIIVPQTFTPISSSDHSSISPSTVLHTPATTIPPDLSSITPSPTTTTLTTASVAPSTPTSPTPPPDPTPVMIIRVQESNGHIANINCNITCFNEFSLCMNSSLTDCIALFTMQSGSNFIYDVTQVSNVSKPSSRRKRFINPFICEVVDLFNLSTRFNGNITCKRQVCVPASGKNCSDITMAGTMWYWSAAQELLAIEYDPRVAPISCSTCKPISNSTQPSTPGATTVQTATPAAADASKSQGDDGHSAVILGVIFGILVAVVAVILAVVWYRSRQGKHRGAVRFQSRDELMGPKNRGARLESVNSETAELEFTDLHGGSSSAPSQPTLDISGSQYVAFNNRGAQYQNVKVNQGAVGVTGANTSSNDYAHMGTQTPQPIHLHSTAPAKAQGTPRSSNVYNEYNEPADNQRKSLAQENSQRKSEVAGAAENPYFEIEENYR